MWLTRMLRKSFLGRLYNMKWGLVKEQILPKGYTRVAQAAMIWFGAHDRIAQGLFAVPASTHKASLRFVQSHDRVEFAGVKVLLEQARPLVRLVR